MRKVLSILLLLALIVVARFMGFGAARLGQEGSSSQVSQSMSQFLNELQEFERTVFIRSETTNAAYQHDLIASGFPSLFDVARLGSDTTFSESELIISRAKAALAKYKLQKYEDVLFAESEINSLKISGSEKMKMSASFKQESGKYEQNFALEEQSMSEASKIIWLLANSHEWSVQDNAMLFRDKDLQNEIEAHFQVILDLSRQSQELHKVTLDKAGLSTSASRTDSQSLTIRVTASRSFKAGSFAAA